MSKSCKRGVCGSADSRLAKKRNTGRSFRSGNNDSLKWDLFREQCDSSASEFGSVFEPKLDLHGGDWETERADWPNRDLFGVGALFSRSGDDDQSGSSAEEDDDVREFSEMQKVLKAPSRSNERLDIGAHIDDGSVEGRRNRKAPVTRADRQAYRKHKLDEAWRPNESDLEPFRESWMQIKRIRIPQEPVSGSLRDTEKRKFVDERWRLQI